MSIRGKYSKTTNAIIGKRVAGIPICVYQYKEVLNKTQPSKFPLLPECNIHRNICVYLWQKKVKQKKRGFYTALILFSID
ncbi:hypothetical protein Pelsub_P2037 [Pelolinea submarina]|nr:hypothetical protein Pelsub_P2037 [Pelolinea submarina]